MSRLAMASAAVVLVLESLLAQTPASTTSFDVAAIKRSTGRSNGPFGSGLSIGSAPGGRWATQNATLMIILQVTYDLYPQQIVGGPAWLNTERFDITAKAAERVSEAQTIEMVKSLLADRFGLRSHVEQRRLPVIAVVLARTDGRLGPGLRRPAVDCGRGSDPSLPSKPRTSDSSGPPFPCGGTRMTTVDGVRRLRLNGQPLLNVFVLSGARAGLGRPLVDRTGLTGVFDIAVDWEVPADAPRDGGDVLSAIQDHLGLKLVRRDEMLDVLVIDAVEMPEFD